MDELMLKDYLANTINVFRQKYPNEDFGHIIMEVKELTFAEEQIPRLHLITISEAGKNRKEEIAKIKKDLEKKRFSHDYITAYIEVLSAGTDKDKLTEGALKELLGLFEYKKKRLVKKNLLRSLDTAHLILRNTDADTKRFVTDFANDLLQNDNFTQYESGLNSLIQHVESSPRHKKVKGEDFEVGELIGVIDPKITRQREKFYTFWRGVHPEYKKLKDAIKEVLVLWERIETEVEKVDEEQITRITGLKDVERYVTDLDKDLEVLYDIHQEMSDDMNYVVKLDGVGYPVASDDDYESSINVENMLVEALRDIFDMPELEERVADEDEEDDTFSIDQESRASFGTEGISEGTTGVAATTTFRGETGPMQISAEEYRRKIGTLERIADVDPLYAIAAERGLLSNKFNKRSYDKFMQILAEHLQDAEDDDSSMKGQLDEIIQNHKSMEKQVANSDGPFYAPYVWEIANLYSTIHEGRWKSDMPDFDKVTKLHRKIIKAIQDLIQDPLDKTSVPDIWDRSSTDPGVSGRGETSQGSKKRTLDEWFVFISRFRMGNRGSMRELGEFQEAIDSLIEKTHDYYVKPANEGYLPFNDLPQYLDTNEMAALVTKGSPNDVTTNLFLLFTDYGLGLVSGNDLGHINAYRNAISNPSTERHLIKTTERVLDVMEDLTPDMETELRYFAYILNNIATRNSRINVSQLKLKGKSVEELVEEYEEKTPAYKNLIKLIRANKTFFMKDKHKAPQMKEFLRLHREKEDEIKLSETEHKILSTHDEIRKMLDKPIYLGYCESDNYDHINDAIDLIKQEYNKDLNATDIIGIVNEFNSMNAVAKKYGTNEDIVYTVKALFR